MSIKLHLNGRVICDYTIDHAPDPVDAYFSSAGFEPSGLQLLLIKYGPDWLADRIMDSLELDDDQLNQLTDDYPDIIAQENHEHWAEWAFEYCTDARAGD